MAVNDRKLNIESLQQFIKDHAELLKDAQRLNAIGAELAQQYGVRWLPSDFKKREGYKRSIELSKQYGLYGRNTAAVCTANRLTTRRRGSRITAVTIHHAQVPYPCAHDVCNEKNGRN